MAVALGEDGRQFLEVNRLFYLNLRRFAPHDLLLLLVLGLSERRLNAFLLNLVPDDKVGKLLGRVLALQEYLYLLLQVLVDRPLDKRIKLILAFYE